MTLSLINQSQQYCPIFLTFLFHLFHPEFLFVGLFFHKLKGISFIPLTPFGATAVMFQQKAVFAWQVRPRPRDLLVRLHRRAGLPERQGYPAQRLLPDRHCHPAPRQPAGPNAATRAGIKEKGMGRKKKNETCHTKKKVERMNGRKESIRLRDRKGRKRGGYQDTEAIWLSCRARLSAKKRKKKIHPELRLTLCLCLLPPSLSPRPSFTALKNTHQHSV